MRQPTDNRRRGMPAVLWSEIFALWRNSARRPALPLLLALLLFVAAPFAATADCSAEMGTHSHQSGVTHTHDSATTADEHHAHDAAPHAAASHGATVQSPATCCSCSSEPLHAMVATLSTPHHSQADSHALVYADVSALPVYRFDALEGLRTRAGPPTGRPQLLSLASLIGRAPPVSF